MNIDFVESVLQRWELLKDQEILRVKNNKDNVTYYKRIGKIRHKEIDWEQKLDEIKHDAILGSIRGERYLQIYYSK